MACPESCEYDGETYLVGETFPDTDGCNTCTCETGGEVACTLMECLDSCDYGGVTYTVGETFDAGDGCNTCTCEASDQVSCTEIGCETACTSDGDCPESGFCDFEGDDCGLWGGEGTCMLRPEACTAEVQGDLCGCDDSYGNNDCVIQSTGTDLNLYGGCQTPTGAPLFVCGDTTCIIGTDYCSIAMNDVMGEGQPLFFATCVEFSPICDAESPCDCVTEGGWTHCDDSNGTTIVIYPGG